jgi:(p)ppGpp synthase/HD superfamily hydrolase
MMFRFGSETEMIVAVLHDVVEDSPDWDFERLRREGFSEEIVQAIDHLTRREDESYEAFVERSGQDPLARRIKLADLEDNMNVTRLHSLTEPDQARLARYHRAWVKLTGSTG